MSNTPLLARQLRPVTILLAFAFVVAGLAALHVNHRWSIVDGRLGQLESLLQKSTYEIARLRQQSQSATTEIARLRHELQQAETAIARLAPEGAAIRSTP